MLILVLIGTIFMLWLWSRRNRNKDEPPLASNSKLLFGHTFNYAGNSAKLWKYIVKLSNEALQRGGVLKTTIGPRTLYVISDPEDFATASNACFYKDAVYDFARPWVGDGLMTSKRELYSLIPSKTCTSISLFGSNFKIANLWKVHRKLLNPAFNQNVLDNFMGVFNSQSRCLVDDIKVEVGKKPFDHWEYTKTNALETICLTALGVDIKKRDEENIDFVIALEKLFNSLVVRFQQFWLHSNFIFNLSNLRRKQDEWIQILQATTNKILKEKKSHFINNLPNGHNGDEKSKGGRFKPFMELLLELSRENDVITDLVVREQMDTFIVAGHDTTAVAVMFCILMVGSYPKVQEKVYQELKNVFGNEHRDVTKQDLSQLVYLDAVLKETMRYYPVVPTIGRHLEEDIKLRNCTLYKGNSVFMLFHGVNRHPMWGPDVDEFIPERWLDTSTLPKIATTFIAFGVGRRNCIGKNYAMMSIKVVLAHFFRNYKVQGDHTKLELKMDVLLKPVFGHHISIEKRNLLS